MSKIEKQLAEYRAKQQNIEDKESEINIYKKLSSENVQKVETEKLLSGSSSYSDLSETLECQNTFTSIDMIYYSCCFLFWATLYAIFIQLQFGTVYLIVSCLIGIYFNTRTNPKKEGEVSAYSVFNKNCKSIDGTLKAEQFEMEIRHGYAAVR